MHGADLGFLFDDKGSAAFGTGLVDRHIGRSEIAIRITRATVEDSRTAASTFACRTATDKFALVALGAFDAHGDRPRVFALWIAGAADVVTEAAVLFHQTVAAESAFFVQRLVGLVRDASSLHEASRSLAIGITGAGEKSAKASTLDGHFAATVFAINGFRLSVTLFELVR